MNRILATTTIPSFFIADVLSLSLHMVKDRLALSPTRTCMSWMAIAKLAVRSKVASIKMLGGHLSSSFSVNYVPVLVVNTLLELPDCTHFRMGEVFYIVWTGGFYMLICLMEHWSMLLCVGRVFIPMLHDMTTSCWSPLAMRRNCRQVYIVG